MRIVRIMIYFENVLADFDGRVKELWGLMPPEVGSFLDSDFDFWVKICKEERFYKDMAPLPGSIEMVKAIYDKYKNICQIISESHLEYSKSLGRSIWAEEDRVYDEKWEWRQKYIPVEIESTGTLCMSDCWGVGDILIDSREEYIRKWNEKGGTGILFKSPQDTLNRLRDIEEYIREENRKLLIEKWYQTLKECKEKADAVKSAYYDGLITGEEERAHKLRIADDVWSETLKFCSDEGMNLEDEIDNAYQDLYDSVGITIKKVPIRYYPSVEWMTGSCYYFYGLNNEESLYNDNDPVGKTFKFQKQVSMGNEKVYVDYFFKIEREDKEAEKRQEGWKIYDGMGKLEGYRWSEGSIKIREHEGEIQSIAIQKTYARPSEPIWKKHSFNPVEEYMWIGIHEKIPDDLDIPEGGFYFDQTLDPPKGRHYREQGILAYDDTEEIVILGITDMETEIVEIPSEINGKPVTILDERCFENVCENLKKVVLPDTLREIGDYAFARCNQLEKPVIPSSVVKIGKDIYWDGMMD